MFNKKRDSGDHVRYCHVQRALSVDNAVRYRRRALESIFWLQLSDHAKEKLMIMRSEIADGHHRAAHASGSRCLAVATAAILLAGCQPETKVQAPEVRPVRTVTVMKRDVGETVTYTGRIEAETETRLSFRIGGRMVERAVSTGDRVEPGQMVAKLEPQNELNALRSAQAAVTVEAADWLRLTGSPRQRCPTAFPGW